MEKVYYIASRFAQVDLTPLPGGSRNNATAGTIQTIFNIVLGIAGAIAMLIIVIAGLQYILSQGNPQAVGKAKNAIIYGLVGLVITMLAFVIVGYVVRSTT
ncbi:MAG TPA: pilin [Candidatus Saccharimonadales bacterium]|nr:pilin [Candidatus Saccharimonadales bacterium]